MFDYQVSLELSIARRWLRDGNISRAWLHLGLAKYYFLQEDRAAEQSVHWTLRLWARLKNNLRSGLRQ